MYICKIKKKMKPRSACEVVYSTLYNFALLQSSFTQKYILAWTTQLKYIKLGRNSIFCMEDFVCN